MIRDIKGKNYQRMIRKLSYIIAINYRVGVGIPILMWQPVFTMH